jgi:hypothetical protein
VKGVLVSAYYGLIGHGCSAAARALKLPIGDIQHGVAGRAHHAYSWPNAGNFGFNTLPGHFFCWSKKEAGEMSQLSPDWNPEMHVIGNVWALLDNVLDEKGSLEPIAAKARAGIKSAVQNARDEFATKKWDAEVNILLALHPEEQLPWLAELQAIAPAEWRLWIRLHPGDFKNDVARAAPWKHFEDERTEVVLPTKAPLNAVLAEIDIVLTKYSSVALDALAYGVPTVAYSDSATLFFGKLDKSELMICTPDAKSICAAIAQRVSSNDGGRLERQQPSDFSSMGLVIRDRFVNAFLPA